MNKIIKILSFLVITFLNQVSAESNWIEPNAWGREYQDLDILKNNHLNFKGKCNVENTCPSDKSNNDLTLIFYKKFISTLFNRKKMQFDVNARVYTRSLEFVLTKEQLELLENLENMHDPRDLDNLVMQICLKARTVDLSKSSISNNFQTGQLMSIPALFWDIFKDLLQLLKTSEIQFTLIAMLIIICGYVLHRRYKLKVVGLIVGGTVLYGYYIKYLECNKQLEIEQMLEMLEQNHNKEENEEPTWWYGFVSFKSWWSNESSNKKKMAEQLRKSVKIQLPYCRPDHVAMMYLNDLFIKQLQILLEECTKTFEELNARLSFPFNIIAIIMLVILIGYILKLIFKYVISPKAWIAVFNRSTSVSGKNEQLQQQPYQCIQPPGDYLSGENLQILLNAFSATNNAVVSNVLATSNAVSNNQKTATNSLAASGVQEVIEKLMPPQQKQAAAATTAIECDDTDFSNASGDSTDSNSYEIIKPTNLLEVERENDETDCSEVPNT